MSVLIFFTAATAADLLLEAARRHILQSPAYRKRCTYFEVQKTAR